MNSQIEWASNQGDTIVVAAGNAQVDTANVSPCSAPRALCVGASTRDDVLTSFSNYGDEVGIHAIGMYVKAASMNGASRTVHGTSFSAPAVAGAIAQLKGWFGDTLDENVGLMFDPKQLLVCASHNNIIRGLASGVPNFLLTAGRPLYNHYNAQFARHEDRVSATIVSPCIALHSDFESPSRSALSELTATSDGTASNPFCSWFADCVWSEAIRSLCALALCKANGFSYSRFVAGNDYCTSPRMVQNESWVFDTTYDVFIISQYERVSKVTAHCSENATFNTAVEVPPPPAAAPATHSPPAAPESGTILVATTIGIGIGIGIGA